MEEQLPDMDVEGRMSQRAREEVGVVPPSQPPCRDQKDEWLDPKLGSYELPTWEITCSPTREVSGSRAARISSQDLLMGTPASTLFFPVYRKSKRGLGCAELGWGDFWGTGGVQPLKRRRPGPGPPAASPHLPRPWLSPSGSRGTDVARLRPAARAPDPDTRPRKPGARRLGGRGRGRAAERVGGRGRGAAAPRAAPGARGPRQGLGGAMAAGSITTLPTLPEDGGSGAFPPGHFKDPKRLYCKNGGFFLRIHPDGRVDGVREKSDPHIKLQLQAEERGVVSIKGVCANRYLAMKEDGRLLASKCVTDECFFFERLESNNYNTYRSRKYSSWYVALKRTGQYKLGPKTGPGQKAILFLPMSAKS
nr:PREDICTED: LOW QUALITY PROTEIN: fibroblast growth factor 2 [Bos indicus]